MTLQGVSRASAALICVGLVTILVLSMFMTNPTRLGPTGVTLWFVGFWMVFASCLSLLKYELVMRFGKDSTKLNRHKMVVSSIRHGALLAGGITVLLALSSLQQLDVRDVGLVTALILLIEFFARARA